MGRRMVIMMISKCDGGRAAAIETIGQNPLLSVCETLPLHLLRAHRGPVRYMKHFLMFVK